MRKYRLVAKKGEGTFSEVSQERVFCILRPLWQCYLPTSVPVLNGEVLPVP
jgi:hypothetical protein